MPILIRACPPAPLAQEWSRDRVQDFACGYELTGGPDQALSAEHWARSVWQEAPAALRLILVIGWRFVLGLRLGPLNAPDRILGWSILRTSDDETLCSASSRLLEAYNAFRATDSGVVWTTTVFYRRSWARIIWRPVSLMHRPLARLALRGAARRRAAATM